MSIGTSDLCFEYFDCKELDCIRRQKLTANCWDIDDVRCQSHSKDFEELKSKFNSKLDACKLCIYYTAKNQSQIFAM